MSRNNFHRSTFAVVGEVIAVAVVFIVLVVVVAFGLLNML